VGGISGRVAAVGGGFLTDPALTESADLAGNSCRFPTSTVACREPVGRRSPHFATNGEPVRRVDGAIRRSFAAEIQRAALLSLEGGKSVALWLASKLLNVSQMNCLLGLQRGLRRGQLSTGPRTWPAPEEHRTDRSAHLSRVLAARAWPLQGPGLLGRPCSVPGRRVKPSRAPGAPVRPWPAPEAPGRSCWVPDPPASPCSEPDLLVQLCWVLAEPVQPC
jgi:hypothetical protein